MMRGNPYGEFMGSYKHYNGLARSPTEDSYHYDNSNLNGFNQKDALVDDSSSAEIIKKIVQDLVDLQQQIIGGKIGINNWQLIINYFRLCNYFTKIYLRQMLAYWRKLIRHN